MDYKLIIGYIASITGDGNYHEELEELHGKFKNCYSDKELKIYYEMLIEKIGFSIRDYEKDLRIAQALGTNRLSYSNVFFEVAINQDLSLVIECLKYAEKYFQNQLQHQDTRLELDFEKLPDYIPDDVLAKLMDWTLSTISTKHSKGELACVKGLRLTPKLGLFEFLAKKTEGMKQDPTEWFKDRILKKAKKK